jgi:hypothetical protein
MATEKLKFKLELWATMWDQPPHVEILIGDKSYFKNPITGTEKDPDVIEFEHECEEGQNYELIINRSNKLPGQTVVEWDHTDQANKIVKDQLLHIKSIEIDEIDIGGLVYEGVYTPQYPEPWKTSWLLAGNDLPETLKNVTIMGHDGEWKFAFSSPFYMWLLENLY